VKRAADKPVFMYSNILVAHERLIDALHALDTAAALAEKLHAELFVLGILTPGPAPIMNRDHSLPGNLAESSAFKQLHEQAEAWANRKGLRAKVETHVGPAIHLIERFAREYGANLLVFGDIDHTGTWGSLIESSADHLSLRTGCDVLIVR
jgi:nucleotide-binding universal stress UspA family protein